MFVLKEYKKAAEAAFFIQIIDIHFYDYCSVISKFYSP